MKIAAAMTIAALLCGCVSEKAPEVITTRPWESRYGSVQEFHEKTHDIQLGKGESVWVLSNETLKRLLKSTGK